MKSEIELITKEYQFYYKNNKITVTYTVTYNYTFRTNYIYTLSMQVSKLYIHIIYCF